MYVRPFENEFGWSDGVISNALALQIALYGLTGPFAAAAMERYGVRKTAVVAIALLAAAMLALTRIDSAWQLLLWAPRPASASVAWRLRWARRLPIVGS